jgi:hypothetical protein
LRLGLMLLLTTVGCLCSVGSLVSGESRTLRVATPFLWLQPLSMAGCGIAADLVAVAAA